MQLITWPLKNPCTAVHWLMWMVWYLIDIRKKDFNVDSLKVLFEDISSDNIFNFLKEIFSLQFLIRNIHLVSILNCLNV